MKDELLDFERKYGKKFALDTGKLDLIGHLTRDLGFVVGGTVDISDFGTSQYIREVGAKIASGELDSRVVIRVVGHAAEIYVRPIKR